MQQLPQLKELKDLLEPLGVAHLVDQHILYPGQRRQQLLRALITRLLGGRSVDDISFPGAESFDSLADDERFAEKCRFVLKLLGICATPEQLRGCSGNQEYDMRPVVDMARLVQVMEGRRALASRPASRQSEQQQQLTSTAKSAPPSAEDLASLLAGAAANISKLASDCIQLFPSDMNDLLKTYNDQGSLRQLPHLHKQAADRAQQVQQQLQQLLAAGGSVSENAGCEEWQQLVAQTRGAFQELLQEMQTFDAVYQQELSVWADVANAQQQQQLPWSPLQPPHSSPPGMIGGFVSMCTPAERLGLMARNLVVSYRNITALMEAFSTVMMHHQALKDIPAATLQEQRAHHITEANRMHQHAQAVQQQ